MGFRTKLDYSDNRQITQRVVTTTTLSGATIFGVPFSALTTGPDLTTLAIIESYGAIVSTFSGNTGETVYNFNDSRMGLAETQLSALTSSNSGITQDTGNIFTGNTPFITQDGYSVFLDYTGVSYNVIVTNMVESPPGVFSGSIQSDLSILSATSLDYTGRTIWNETQGISKTNELIIDKNPIIGYVFTCSDSEGKGSWMSVSAATSAVTYWSASTGINAIVPENSNSLASGLNAIAIGYQTTASGSYSFAEGNSTTASGTTSHAEGQTTQAIGLASHAEGQGTSASGLWSHAEGLNTKATGTTSHAEGFVSMATGIASHAEGQSTQAIGDNSHAEGISTIASGTSSHAEGQATESIGDYSHAEGNGVIANGISSHAEGQLTQTIGQRSHSGGYNSIASGDTSFVHGSGSTANGINTIVFGANITGNTDNTLYLDQLNIKTIGAGPGITDIGVDAGGYVVNQASDISLKNNIEDITSALDKILKLRGVYYNWRDITKGGADRKLGFIAQEVESVIPELVYTDKNTGLKILQYKEITALLVEAIKELVSEKIKISNSELILETQTLLAEDNNIELNYGGNHLTASGGGITVLHAVNDGIHSEIKTDENGNFIVTTGLVVTNLKLPKYTPTSTNDAYGNIGNIVWDDDYQYQKTTLGWKRTKLEEF